MKTEDFDKNFLVGTPDENGLCYMNITEKPFVTYGLMPSDEKGYHRMNPKVAKKCNDGVAFLNYHTAGGRVRFATDSDTISIKAESVFMSKMPHMAFTGSIGFDLYEKLEGEYIYRGSFIPPVDIEDGYTSSINVGEGRMRDYTLNFPLYGGIKKLEIGLKAGSKLGAGEKYRDMLPVVYYGSSITQGGCASRPGNAYQTIVSRKLDIDHINLGFSGSAKAEKAMCDYLANLEMSVFVCDYDHNAPTLEHLRKTLPTLIETFRKKQPETPIIMMSRPQCRPNEDEIARRDTVKGVYESQLAKGDKNIFFIDGSRITLFFGGDSATVDGSHPNDLGFMCMAKSVWEVLEKII